MSRTEVIPHEITASKSIDGSRETDNIEPTFQGAGSPPQAQNEVREQPAGEEESTRESPLISNNLCSYCQNIVNNWPSQKIHGRLQFPHYDTKDSFESSVNGGCSLCAQFNLGEQAGRSPRYVISLPKSRCYESPGHHPRGGFASLICSSELYGTGSDVYCRNARNIELRIPVKIVDFHGGSCPDELVPFTVENSYDWKWEVVVVATHPVPNGCK